MLKIRPETPADYADIARVNVYAFDNRAAEANLVALHRQLSSFDPQLSLVVELDGRVVGHVLLTPHTIRLMDQDVRAVNLAPIAVHPSYQRQGIGAELIEAGHVAARAKGYALSFLIGHPAYYPRLGYRTHAYGSSSLTIPVSELAPGGLEARGLLPDDLPALEALWRNEEERVDFAIRPGPELLDWLSPNPAVTTAVYVRQGELVGYTRMHSAQPERPLAFLARDAQVARHICATIGQQSSTGSPLAELVLPLHPLSGLTSGLGTAHEKPIAACMAYPLLRSPFDEYYDRVTAGERPVGRLVWPPVFDLA